MCRENNCITLWPLNWFYNSGVIGLVKIWQALGKECQFNDNTVSIPLDGITPEQVLEVWKEMSLAGLDEDDHKKIYGKHHSYYPNVGDISILKRIIQLLSFQPTGRKIEEFVCSVCGSVVFESKDEAKYLNSGFGRLILSSESSFPNAYWGGKANNYVCPKCRFILTCHHLGFTRIPSAGESSEIFINAPSFQTIYYLHELAQNFMNKSSAQLKQILNISLLEKAIHTKMIHTFAPYLGLEWIVKTPKYIHVNSLPPDALYILSNHNIVNMLYKIGEITILEYAVNGKYHQILKTAYELLRNARTEKNKTTSNGELLKRLKLKSRTKNLIGLAENLIELHALILEHVIGYAYST